MPYEILGKYIFMTASAAAALSVPQDTASYFQLVHDCHYSCECGPPRGFGCEQQYHRHLHMLCLPVRCDRHVDCERTPPEGACRHVAPQ
jgi:hypothetical protein